MMASFMGRVGLLWGGDGVSLPFGTWRATLEGRRAGSNAEPGNGALLSATWVLPIPVGAAQCSVNRHTFLHSSTHGCSTLQ